MTHTTELQKIVSILAPILWGQQIGWSYCATSQTFAWSRGMTQFEQKGQFVMQSAWHAVHSVVVMLQVWYAIAFWFDSHLLDFPFLFLLFS